jgi:hypothetical protein
MMGLPEVSYKANFAERPVDSVDDGFDWLGECGFDGRR